MCTAWNRICTIDITVSSNLEGARVYNKTCFVGRDLIRCVKGACQSPWQASIIVFSVSREFFHCTKRAAPRYYFHIPTGCKDWGPFPFLILGLEVLLIMKLCAVDNKLNKTYSFQSCGWFSKICTELGCIWQFISLILAYYLVRFTKNISF